MLFPYGDGNVSTDGSSQLYETGGGANLGIEFDIASLLTLGVEGSLLFSPFVHGDGQLSIYAAGGALGLYFFPFSRIPIRVDGAVGVYSANDGQIQAPWGLWYRFGGETGFRFTPGLTLTLGGGWRQYQSGRQFVSDSKPLYSGIYAALGARLTFELGEQSSGGASALLDQYDAVFPVLTPLYQNFPIGNITVRNNENAEIRNVRVLFRAGNYTSSEFPCGEANRISKGRRYDFPLYADFSPEVLRFADNGRILGEIIIRYSFLGREREAVRAATIAVNNRNTVVPGDNAALAAFVSASNTEVLQFAKYTAALARTNHRMGLSSNMETGIWLFEAVRQIVGRGLSANTEARGRREGEAQFPSQTIAYGSGSPLDAALLYAACLQSVGISAAFIMLPTGEIIAALDLGMSRDDASAAALFDGPNKLLVVGNEVWLPAAISRLREGFTVAWQEAIRSVDSLNESGGNGEMIIIEEAWKTYPAAPFPSLGIRLVMPDSSAVNTAANAVVRAYINSEFAPKLRTVQQQIQRNPSASLYNQLGSLYLRSGQMAQAKGAYETAAGMGSVGAMVNRGNIALSENNIAAAERWFRQALAREPNNRGAARGIEFVEARK